MRISKENCKELQKVDEQNKLHKIDVSPLEDG